MSEGKRITPVFDYQKGRKELFRPLKLYECFSKDIQNVIALGVAEQATQNYNEEKGVPEVGSFLFSRKAQEVFEKTEGEAALLSLLSQCFQKYGIYDLAVVENAQYGYLSLNLENMPVNIDWPDTDTQKRRRHLLTLHRYKCGAKRSFSLCSKYDQADQYCNKIINT